jgi:NADPH:quinone reductase-like Zn-dependent oxidoreductase
MRAVIIKGHGPKEVLEEAEVPDPTPAPGEALVRVRACALNHLDLWTRNGIPGRTIPFPHILGSDISGEILSLGAAVHGLSVGERVMLQPGVSCGRCTQCLSGADNACRFYAIFGAQRPGGYAEKVACPTANLVPIPDQLPFDQAAAFPLVFLTAWHMLVTLAKLRPGEDLLVWGAGSGVGTAAIQIAKYLGARVIATASNPQKLEKARELGADFLIDHSKGDVVGEVRRITLKKGVEVVFEHVGKATWERSILSLAHRGRLVTCGATTGPDAVTDIRYLFSKQLALLGSYMGSKADLLEVAVPFFAGKLRVIIDSVFPLSEARKAHERLATSGHFGKIVLKV